MTTETKSREEAFVERMEQLGTGELAMLRRGCGERDPVEGRCPWFLSHIHGIATEPVAFLLASLFAQYKTSDIRAGRHRIHGNFGTTWKLAIAGSDSESIKRRFHIALDAGYDPRTGDGDLPYRLRQMVRFAASNGIGVDWPLLLKHLRSWDAPTKWVQKDWARSFFTNERHEDAFTPKLEGE